MSGEPIAIVGRACRFSGQSISPSAFWKLLENPTDVSSPLSPSRFQAEAFYHPDPLHAGTSNVKSGYLLDQDVGSFDAGFFNIKPVEASAMDPQQRLLLEVVYETLESAGITMDDLDGSNTAVFVGIMNADYATMLASDPANFPRYFATGTASSMASSRVSHFFNWHGPSMTIDTACSSSLIAVHQAVQSLRQEDCDTAMVGGSNLLLSHAPFVAESKLQMLSPDGKSKMWSADANGYARGEGTAAVCLKRLSTALRDGNAIHGVIRESHVNHDGNTHGITKPSMNAQVQLIRDTYAKSGLDLSNHADWPQFFEAHGTGTQAGDETEAKAIHEAFFNFPGLCTPPSTETHKLPVGSVKTVIGHTEGAAGLAGLLKASLAINNKVLPPNLLFDHPSSMIKPLLKNLAIGKTALPWPNCNIRRASINSFGFGGANAHVILESFAQPLRPSIPSFPVLPFVFSAASKWSLRLTLEQVLLFLQRHDGISADSVRNWVLKMRGGFRVCISFNVTSLADLAAQIESSLAQDESLTLRMQTKTGAPPDKQCILGIFTGQGAQWAQMGINLVAQHRPAKQKLAHLQASLDSLTSEDRPNWVLERELERDARSSRIGEAVVSQTLCTAVQVLLVDVLKLIGLSFDIVIGHSSGEIAAAYAAGYLSDKDAIRVAYYRGLASTLFCGIRGQPGAMLAAGCSEGVARSILTENCMEKELVIAAINSPSSVTLSGDADVIDKAKDTLTAQNIFARVLKTDRAYHSHHVLASTQAYLKYLKKASVKCSRPHHSTTTWISSVYGQDIESIQTDLSCQYWTDNMAMPVAFMQAFDAISNANTLTAAVEVGPHPALQKPGCENLERLGCGDLNYFATLRRGQSDTQSIQTMFAEMWQRSVVGAEHAKLLLRETNPRSMTAMGFPSYPFDHQERYWHESKWTFPLPRRLERPNSLLGMAQHDRYASQLQWRNCACVSDLPWAQGHVIQGQATFPATGYLAMAIEAALIAFEERVPLSLTMDEVVISQAIIFPEDNVAIDIISSMTDIQNQEKSATFAFAVTSTVAGSSRLNARCRMRVEFEQNQFLDAIPEPDDITQINVDPSIFYDSLAKHGYDYSGRYHDLRDLRRSRGFAAGHVQSKSDSPSHMVLDPAILDSALQMVLLAVSWPGDTSLRGLWLPTSFEKVVIDMQSAQAPLPTHTRYKLTSSSLQQSNGYLSGEATIGLDRDKNLVRIHGMHVRPLQLHTAADDVCLFSRLDWEVSSPTWAHAGPVFKSHPSSVLSDLERIAHFYLRQLSLQLPKEKRSSLSWTSIRLLAYADSVVDRVTTGKYRYGNLSWEDDTIGFIDSILHEHKNLVDAQMLSRVGKAIHQYTARNESLLEALMQDDLLARFYRDGLAMQEYLQVIAIVVSQVCFQNPHANILEIGAGTGGATRTILDRIQGSFAKYTFTDISSGFFAAAQSNLASSADQLEFKRLNIESDPIAQGFEPASFDIIVASLVIHATNSIGQSLANARRLLKPNGWLVLLEITNLEQIRFGLLFGGLEGWWLGSTEDRALTPCIDAEGWDSELTANGFSKIALNVSDDVELPVPFSVICAQAADSTPSPALNSILGLSVLCTTRSKDAVSKIVTELRPMDDSHEISLLDLDVEPTPINAGAPGNQIMLVVDGLGHDLLEDLNQSSLTAMQSLVSTCTGLLWLELNESDHKTKPRMALGLCRTLATEIKTLHVKHVTIACEPDTHVTQVKKAIETFKRDYDTQMQSAAVDDSHLQHFEPQIRETETCSMLPRLVLDQHCNNRYNSIYRPIHTEVKESSLNFTLKATEDRLEPAETYDPRTLFRGTTAIFEVSQSLAVPRYTPEAPSLHIVLGPPAGKSTEIQFVGICTHPAKYMRFNENAVEPAKISVTLPYLDLIASLVSLSFLVPIVKNGATLLMIDADEVVVRSARLLLCEQSGHSEISPDDRRGPSPRILSISRDNPHLSQYLDWANVIVCVKSTLEQELTMSRLAGAETIMYHRQSDVSRRGDTCAAHDLKYDERLHHASQLCDQFNHYQGQLRSSLVQTPLGSLAKNVSAKTSLIDWQSKSGLHVRYTRASSLIRFDPEGIYWLIGLTGGLGRSLAAWMFRRGARHVVLSSRNPNIPQSWQTSMQRRGAIVMIVRCNVTDKCSLQHALAYLATTGRRLCGVVNGAMVLKDAAFTNQTLQNFEDVVGPKVSGSRILDELLQRSSLDFIVHLSSMASMIGNAGQAFYAAASHFLSELAQTQRERGWRASAVLIGAIVGNGFVSRELALSKQKNLENIGNVLMSEDDFFEIFAEGVLLACDLSKPNGSLCTGLRMMKHANGEFTWANNPIFQHLMHIEGGQSASHVQQRLASVKERLVAETDRSVARQILKESLLSKLASALQRSDDESLLDEGSDEAGIDSLIAVDLRSFLQKEFSLDIPVLKILSSSKLSDLVNSIADAFLNQSTLEFKTDVTGSNNALSADADLSVQHEQRATKLEHVGKNSAQDLTPQKPVANIRRRKVLPLSSKHLVVEKQQMPAASSGIPNSFLQRKSFETSLQQEALWVAQQATPRSTAFNVSTMTRIYGHVDVERFSQALTQVHAAHEILRSSIKQVNGRLEQDIQSDHLMPLLVKKDVTFAAARKYYESCRSHVYDLASGKTWQAALFQVDKNVSFFVLSYHHIIMDGISFETFVANLYEAYERGTLSMTPQYGHFAMQQRAKYMQGAWSPELDYWAQWVARNYRKSSIHRDGSLSMPTSSTRYETELDQPLAKAINTVSETIKCQPFVFYLSAYAIMMSAEANQSDICIGIMDGGRHEEALRRCLGCFLNMYPVFVKSQGSFKAVLEATREQLKSNFAHSGVPFEAVLQDKRIRSHVGQGKMFQHAFNFRKSFDRVRTLGRWTTEAFEYDLGQTSFNIALDVMDNARGGVVIAFNVQDGLYSPSEGQQLLKQFSALLQHLCSDISISIECLPLKRAAADEIDHAVGKADCQAIVWSIFETALKADSRPAVLSQGRVTSYKELIARTCTIANHLRRTAGVQPQSRVCVVQHSQLGLYCSVLAIWWIGSVYVPIAVDETDDRTRSMLKATNPACVLTTLEHRDKSCLKDYTCIDIDKIETSSDVFPPSIVDVESEAVVLFTSGTSGIPKGVRLSHRGIAINAQVSGEQWDIEASDRILQQSSPAFDMHLSQICVALLHGATLVSGAPNLRQDPLQVAREIVEKKVTVTEATPSEYSMWLRFGSAKDLLQSRWRTAISGGEKISRSLRAAFQRLNKPSLRLINCYGPTEISFCCCGSDIAYHNDAVLDVPLDIYPQYSIVVVDEAMKDVGPNIVGEICIRGPAVALGYLSIDTDCFKPDPFSSKQEISNRWTRAHLSGDLGMLDDHRRLTLLGRKENDSQIKIRGIRTNLDDIGGLIVAQSGGRVAQAVVIALGHAESADGSPRLAAFLSLSQAPTDSEDASEAAKTVVYEMDLPVHMRPSLIHSIPTIPLNASGKVDKKALAKLAATRSKAAPEPVEASLPISTAKTSEHGNVESTLRRHWAEIVDVSSQDLGLHSDFFQSGGTSLSVLDLQARLKSETGVEVPIADLFRNSTLAGMAGLLESMIPRPEVVSTPQSQPVPAAATEDGEIDWAQETQTAADLPHVNMPPRAGPLTIVLTGATGFIGRHLLRRLVNDTAVQRINCIGIRRDPSTLTAAPYSSPKVRLFAGTLAAPNFGLSAADTATVFAAANVAVHAGAEVSFLKSYAALRCTNVDPVRHLLRLCLLHGLSLHYISSAAVCRLTEAHACGERSLAHVQPTQNVDGYTAAKWVAEQLVERACRDKGLRATVHRPSIVTGLDAPVADVTGNVLKFSKLVGATPLVDRWAGTLDFVSVHQVAQDVMQAIVSPSPVHPESGDGVSQLRFQFSSGELEIPLAELNSELGKWHNRRYLEVEIARWVELAVREGLSPLVAEYLREASSRRLVLPRLMKSG